jgi:hypothetical protein
MTEDPTAYKWIRVSNEDIGEPGCRHWHSRPRWGILGMILNWWRVKVSSGCPLAMGVAPPARCDRGLKLSAWRRGDSAGSGAAGWRAQNRDRSRRRLREPRRPSGRLAEAAGRPRPPGGPSRSPSWSSSSPWCSWSSASWCRPRAGW